MGENIPETPQDMEGQLVPSPKKSHEEPKDPAVAILQRAKFEDTEKALYLSYRTCYLSENEAKKLAGIHQDTLNRWREMDANFNRVEQNLIPFQDKYHNLALSIEFIRNFRMVLQKDYEILIKALSPDTKDILTPMENNYLVKLRGSYSPEYLERLARLTITGDGLPQDFDTFIMTLQQSRSLKLQGGKL